MDAANFAVKVCVTCATADRLPLKHGEIVVVSGVAEIYQLLAKILCVWVSVVGCCEISGRLELSVR